MKTLCRRIEKIIKLFLVLSLDVVVVALSFDVVVVVVVEFC